MCVRHVSLRFQVYKLGKLSAEHASLNGESLYVLVSGLQLQISIDAPTKWKRGKVVYCLSTSECTPPNPRLSKTGGTKFVSISEEQIASCGETIYGHIRAQYCVFQNILRVMLSTIISNNLFYFLDRLTFLLSIFR